MTKQIEEISDKEIEYILAMMEYIGYQAVSEDIISLIIKEFTGQEIDRDILNSLIEKGYMRRRRRYEIYLTIPIEKDVIEPTPEGIGVVYNNLTKRWDKIPTRWRRVIYRSNIKETFPNEKRIMEKLLDAPVAYTKSSFYGNPNLLDLLLLENNGGLEIADKKELIVRRGVNFPERVAQIIFAMEMEGNLQEAGEWRRKWEEVLSCLLEQELKQRWRERFNNSYGKVKTESVCPIGIPEECKTAFKDDADSATPHRHLSSKDHKCNITVKIGFGFKDNNSRRYSTDYIIAEIVQPKDYYFSNIILLKGKKGEIIEILNRVVKEMEKMHNQTGFPLVRRVARKKPNWLDRIMPKVEIVNDTVSLEIPSFAESKNEKIGVVSYGKILEILQQLQKI